MVNGIEKLRQQEGPLEAESARKWPIKFENNCGRHVDCYGVPRLRLLHKVDLSKSPKTPIKKHQSVNIFKLSKTYLPLIQMC